MIPEEDRGPAWLSDYGAIEADIQQMEDFAKALTAEVAKGYDPHANQVAQVMAEDLPTAFPRFTEMSAFMTQHNEVKNVTLANTLNFSEGTNRFAGAAQQISSEYKTSDAFAHATVSDVKEAFDNPSSSTVPSEQEGNN
ncbi:hypothetical protein [Actinoplanes sp. N902-109]|uniref:hypothetical protein n=1 Tax=Actinoplanes sp. (strain N902-109) TaxID=649831 RepID=UPI0003293747|nr:hypothetical protein [Actinoplanes sp. N902-109]AGL20990.1 hypothetical protein L083_7480 [Actinoplanes sp. N902-109]